MRGCFSFLCFLLCVLVSVGCSKEQCPEGTVPGELASFGFVLEGGRVCDFESADLTIHFPEMDVNQLALEYSAMLLSLEGWRSTYTADDLSEGGSWTRAFINNDETLSLDIRISENPRYDVPEVEITLTPPL